MAEIVIHNVFEKLIKLLGSYILSIRPLLFVYRFRLKIGFPVVEITELILFIG
jgi:hypothetical protein